VNEEQRQKSLTDILDHACEDMVKVAPLGEVAAALAAWAATFAKASGVEFALLVMNMASIYDRKMGDAENERQKNRS
jgi:hypothetical protein